MRYNIAAAIAVGVSAAAFAPAWSPACAQQAEEEDPTTLGLAFLYEMEPYGFSEWSPRPIIDWDYGPFSISGSRADLRTPLAGDSWEVSLRARYGLGDGYQASDAPGLAGMADRDGSIWVGPGFSSEIGPVDISAEWLFDAMGNSGGDQIRVGVSADFPVGRFQVTPRVSATWMSDDVVDYYFGVTPAEATPLRPAYAGSAEGSVEAGLRLVYPLTRRHHVMLDLSATAFGGGVGDSPIVADDVTTSVGLGYAFRF
jgi:outer membrane protein